MIWNERESPAATMRCGAARVMSAPASRTRPASGGYNPEIRLNSVVLPAPFGPINACSVRSVTTMLASTTACVPPKLLRSAWASSTTSDEAASGCRNAGNVASATMLRPDIAAATVGSRRIGALTRRQTPTSPVGENTTKPTKSNPKNNSQFGVQIERYSRNRM